MEMGLEYLWWQVFFWGLASLLLWRLAWRQGFCKLNSPAGPDRRRGVIPGTALLALILYYFSAVAVGELLSTVLVSLDYFSEYDVPKLSESLALPLVAGINLVCMSYYSLSESTGLPRRIWWQARTNQAKGVFRQLWHGVLIWPLSTASVFCVATLTRGCLLYLYPSDWSEQPSVDLLRESKEDLFSFLSITFCVVVLIPISEEIFFRGFLQNCLRRYFWVPKALTLTSLIFALAHIVPGGGVKNIEVFVGIFVLSWILGYIYERQGSLWAPIALHGAHNLTMAVIISLT